MQEQKRKVVIMHVNQIFNTPCNWHRRRKAPMTRGEGGQCRVVAVRPMDEETHIIPAEFASELR